MLSRQTGGALALVSGRPIADLDGCLRRSSCRRSAATAPRCACATGEVSLGVTPLPQDLREHLAGAATPGSGIVVEDKGYSLALHYRNAPQHEDRLRAHIDDRPRRIPGEATEVLPGKAMFEVKRPGVSKGDGVRELMEHPPFAGRKPVFIGDDVTDESVFAVLPALRRHGLFGRPAIRRLGRHFRIRRATCAAPCSNWRHAGRARAS